jgi:RNA-directed DNA polymerase
LKNRGLTLNEKKTRLVDIRQEAIKFLGFSVSWRRRKKLWWGYAHVEPHWQSQQKLRDGVRELLNHWTQMRPEEEVMRALNRKLKGWRAYFRYGHPAHALGKLDYYLQNKLRRWLWKRHGKPAGMLERYSNRVLRECWGLSQMA